MQYERNSTCCRPYNSNLLRRSLLAAAVLLVVSGCARPPWNDPLDEEQSNKLTQQYQTIIRRSEICPDSFDAEIAITWETSLESRSVSGYLQVLAPAFLRLTIYNPLGQPNLALSTDGKDYQVLRVAGKTFVSGSLRSFALHQDLPLVFFNGNWFEWLTGRPHPGNSATFQARTDTSGRGIWFNEDDAIRQMKRHEYLLVDLTDGKVLERVIADENDSGRITIAYNDWQQIDNCRQPMSLSIRGLSFRTELNLSLSEVKPKHLAPADFTLPIPPGYLRQFLP